MTSPIPPGHSLTSARGRDDVAAADRHRLAERARHDRMGLTRRTLRPWLTPRVLAGYQVVSPTLSASRSPLPQRCLFTSLRHTETGTHLKRSPGATPQFAVSPSGTGQPHGQLFPGIGPARPVVAPTHRSCRT